MISNFLALLLTSTLPAPLAEPEPRAAAPSPTKPFTPTIARNRGTTLNGQKVNAASLALYIGLASPSIFCPAWIPSPEMNIQQVYLAILPLLPAKERRSPRRPTSLQAGSGQSLLEGISDFPV
jgi:hypothetical protein